MLNKKTQQIIGFILGLGILAIPAHAITIDWNGYFRADNNFIFNYQKDRATPGYSNDTTAGGEYIKGEGQKGATYSTLFAKLKPKILVNDNVIIRSEWNLGDPVAGFFGRGVPRRDQNNSLTTEKDGMNISIARLWLDTHTDFGTLQVGRAPMHWGIGAIFNSGDAPFDRFQSTSDTIRLLSKFGYLTLMPLYAKVSMGQSLAGAITPDTLGTGTVLQGSDDVTDYGLALKYENPEEDLEAGVMYYKRNASDGQNTFLYPGAASTYTSGANGMNLKLFDFYAKKTWRRLELSGELPIYSGSVGDINGVGQRNAYKTTALIGEAAINYDTWRHSAKFGTVPGQGPATTGARGDSFNALYLHRNYKLGQILFRYNLGNFGAANPDPIAPNTYNATTVNPYDAAVTNVKYLMLATEKKGDQWGFNAGLLFAKANESAVIGKDFYNHRTRQWGTAVASQDKNLGMELDLGVRYQWDENVSFGADFGILFPGNYFAFINKVNEEGGTDAVNAISFTAATSF